MAIAPAVAVALLAPASRGVAARRVHPPLSLASAALQAPFGGLLSRAP